uniref:UspA domain-containing protein n=1 Tax=Stereomyxa ramosa TaxID=1078864 RepID=A0A7S2ABC7_9EUKA|mmetsp:Transcript_782/g.982  ORF Transcript_782/g.982 Transcript_782/m.982 type:complete len:136 (+) Transcript_782:18-425(+)|eukprot:CAMPEP_0174251252 /NCGR_PEP_ID=MMETSP0439-20130205/1134_1 /TAXON_ID=0 /ORGANISM="Stereomyxa ramosa, Strain Chinc5" /LENGTH=135 /DNA_ID=CAMNT_0015331519 /DNA_START=22 /DNA_END=429 /DNA_ORIENTATION=-
MTRYMIAVDGSDHSDKAYDIAKKLCREGDVVYFVTVTKKVRDNDGEDSANYKQREHAKELLQTWEKRAGDDGIQSQTVLVEAPDAREALCDVAEEHTIDVMVVGTRGLGTIKRLFLGSVSSYCVQHAKCDVLVAK